MTHRKLGKGQLKAETGLDNPGARRCKLETIRLKLG
jgi:hypothetical protein